MRIARSTIQDGNLYPEAYAYLRSLPSVALHHVDHDLRHPLAIYNISLSRVMNAMSSVLDEYDKLSSIPKDENDEPQLNYRPLLMAQTELLESLLSHIDDNYQILKALHPNFPIKESIPFADKWLEKVKHPTIKDYKRAVKMYRDSFAPIVNRIKHEHGRLGGILMYGQNEHIGGYFLEGVDKKGVVGPDMKVRRGYLGFSLNRDLRYHFTHLYVVGHHLMNAMVGAIDKMYNFKFPSSIYVEEKAGMIEQVADRIQQLPFFFFPDEVHKPTPIVIFHSEKEEIELTLDNTSIIRAYSPRSIRVSVSYSGDGVTRAWRLPYQGYAYDLVSKLI